jgi:thiamine-monophosphate kinase
LRLEKRPEIRPWSTAKLSLSNAFYPRVEAPCPILNKMRRKPGPTTSRKLGELALIDQIRRRVARSSASSLSLGIGDDCALIRLKPGEEAAITTDLSIQDRHFRLDLHPAQAIGHRTLARGLSDIAAMGARPVAAFVSLGLPPELTQSAGRKGGSWLSRFLDGFLALAAEHRTPLAGGDLAQSSIALADIVLVGAVPRGKALLRSGARPGDLVYVTGSLGGSAAGLRLLGQGSSRTKSPELAPHLWPQPRISQGLWLRRHASASAAIDISDGLSTDLDHLCQESGVSVELDASSLPIFRGATLEDALHGGEDYELLFTARSATHIPRSIAGVPVTRIGVITKSGENAPGVVLVDASGRHGLKPGGWEHFRGGPAKPE